MLVKNVGPIAPFKKHNITETKKDRSLLILDLTSIFSGQYYDNNKIYFIELNTLIKIIIQRFLYVFYLIP